MGQGSGIGHLGQGIPSCLNLSLVWLAMALWFWSLVSGLGYGGGNGDLVLRLVSNLKGGVCGGLVVA